MRAPLLPPQPQNLQLLLLRHLLHRKLLLRLLPLLLLLHLPLLLLLHLPLLLLRHLLLLLLRHLLPLLLLPQLPLRWLLLQLHLQHRLLFLLLP